jgi:hypothetical protein
VYEIFSAQGSGAPEKYRGSFKIESSKFIDGNGKIIIY